MYTNMLFHKYVCYSALTSFFRFELKEQVVREDDELVTVCLEMVSAGPLLERVIFFFTAQNGTATGENSNNQDTLK